MINKNGNNDNSQACIHESCEKCNGTGVQDDGTVCVHMASCLCKNCTQSMNPYRNSGLWKKGNDDSWKKAKEIASEFDRLDSHGVSGKQKDSYEQRCVHKDCKECKGTGLKENGAICVHFISCSCSGCTQYQYYRVDRGEDGVDPYKGCGDCNEVAW